MKLKYKIFATLAVTAVLILGMTLGVMQFTIRKNFIEYLNEEEFGRQTRMVTLLKQDFQTHGGWDGFKGRPMAWHRLLSLSRGEDDMPHRVPPPFHKKGGRPMPPGRAGQSLPAIPHDPASLHRRLCLFDADKAYVAGECRQDSRFDYHPIVVSGHRVGYLGLENREDMQSATALAFLKKQTQAFYVIGLGILLILTLVSYAAARHVLSPVRALARGTRAMGKFEFDTRVRVRSNDELGALAADFNRMAQTLGTYETMRKNWISDISHELRTPVAVIRSKIEALQDGIRKPTPGLLESLHHDILGLGTLINDLHRISVMDSQSLSVELKPVPLRPLLDQVLDTFLIRLEQQDIRLETDFGPDRLPVILADPVLLERVFSNLLENTLRYTDSPGRLKLSCRWGRAHLWIVFEDSAPGVPDHSLEAIFERLFRVDRSRSRALGGSGLGLSLSREIIALHKGRIRADHSALGGLKIEIRLFMKADPSQADKKS